MAAPAEREAFAVLKVGPALVAGPRPADERQPYEITRDASR
jgi:hypothetical protein